MVYDQIPTPALLVDLDRLDSNLLRMAEATAVAGKHIRPHFKAHKCIEIAKRQIVAGAVGMCAATVAEVEILARARIGGILLTSPIADPEKARRIALTGAMAVVDDVRQVHLYEAAAAAANVTVELLVDVDVGDHRTGARSIQQAIAIARIVVGAPHLRLHGIQAYSVGASHGQTIDDRRRISADAFQVAARAKAEFERDGIHTHIVSGGSTGTWDVDLNNDHVTELQAGTYALMDLAYGRLEVPFDHALTVVTTVVSANHEKFATVDGGFKSFSTDRGYGPAPLHLPGASYRWGGDEFGFLDFGFGDVRPQLGDRVSFVPPHCDPTVNLYDRIYACRNRAVEDVWQIMNRLAQ